MANKRPVCLYGGDLKELQAGDTLPEVFAVGAVFDGGGAAVAAGSMCEVRIVRSGTIVRATLLADQAGNAVVDVWKDAFANYPPTVADTITAGAKPTLTAAAAYEDATLTGWSKSVTAGDVLVFRVDSNSTCERLVVILEVAPT